MLFCILVFVIVIAGACICSKLEKNEINKLYFVFLFTVVVGVSFGIASISPISGFEEPIIEEYELAPIVNDSNIYIIEKSDSTVICKYINEDAKEEELYTYTDNVEVITVEEGKKPVLKSSITKAKKTIFTFGLLEKTEYTFYVPESNIERWQEKHVD